MSSPVSVVNITCDYQACCTPISLSLGVRDRPMSIGLARVVSASGFLFCTRIRHFELSWHVFRQSWTSSFISVVFHSLLFVWCPWPSHLFHTSKNNSLISTSAWWTLFLHLIAQDVPKYALKSCWWKLSAFPSPHHDVNSETSKHVHSH